MTVIDEPRADLRQLRDRRETAVDVRARPPVAGDDTREHHLVTGLVGEAPLHACFARALPDEHRVGAPRSESTVTIASPVPSWVSTSSRS